MSKESEYNNSLTVADLTRQESLDPAVYNIITYSKPHDVCNGREIHLGNQAGGFPFKCLGIDWRAVEYLYMCGRWSNNTQEHLEVQKDLMTATSGYAVKRYKKSKHLKKQGTDFDSFKIQWMFWCIWQKCLNSSAFREHLLSFSDDEIIVEYVKRDNVWAADKNEQGVFIGGNAVPKILTICRHCIINGTEPDIDTKLLNAANIYIFGKKVIF